MAFLICYWDTGIVDWAQKAIYLKQPLYEQLFEICAANPEFPVLRAIVALAYGDELLLDSDQLKGLQSELRKVLAGPGFNHPQALDLIEIARRAQSRKCGLAIGGDMHPVLGSS